MNRIRNFRELRVYQNAMKAAMEIFEITKSFPKEENFSMVDQMRRSSRSVCANLAEAWRKRNYEKHFISKISDCTGEADETRVWLEISWRCNYISKEKFEKLDADYNLIISQLVKMMSEPNKWTIK